MTLIQRVLNVLPREGKGLSINEIAAAAKMPISDVRTAIKELSAASFVSRARVRTHGPLLYLSGISPKMFARIGRSS